ncbi:MAG: hypothetical protein FJ263_04625 [Planctomycetes bacterium]|nr:hypothetical protein [Planctomycetota bacterium]
MRIVRAVFRGIFNILCLLMISILFFLGTYSRNLHGLWLIIPVSLWIAACKRKTAGYLALAFLICIGIVVIWLFLPDKDNWRPYNFDYELKDFRANRAVPDNQNAAFIYQRITAKLNDSNAPSFFNEGNASSTCVQWKGIEHPETAAFIDARREIVSEAMTASNLDKCVFPLWTNPLDMPTKMVDRMRHIAYLLVSSANRDMGECRIDEAFKKYECLVRMGRHLQSQPSFMELMMGDDIENMAYAQLASVIIDTNLSRTQRDSIRRIIPAPIDDWPLLYPPIFEIEKLLNKNMVAMMFYETDDKGIVRFRQGNGIFPNNASNIQQPHSALQIRMQKLASIGLWFIAPRDPKVISSIFDEEFQRALLFADANNLETTLPLNTSFYLAWLRDPHRTTAQLMVQMSFPVHEKIHASRLQIIARRRGTAILFALRNYKDAGGRWPGVLDEIKTALPAEAWIDPFTQLPFIYKVKDCNFLLYSVGRNKIDEKGKPKPSCRDGSCEIDHSGSDDILIWPLTWKDAQTF